MLINKDKDMTRKEYYILYTLLWLIFIGFLCYTFENAHPLWLLLIYLIGLEEA